MNHDEMLKVPIAVLENDPNDPFLYTRSNIEGNDEEYQANRKKYRFKHENAAPSKIFYDGNNGDRHRVLAADPDNKRFVAQNLSQDLKPRLYIWFN